MRNSYRQLVHTYEFALLEHARVSALPVVIGLCLVRRAVLLIRVDTILSQTFIEYVVPMGPLYVPSIFARMEQFSIDMA